MSAKSGVESLMIKWYRELVLMFTLQSSRLSNPVVLAEIAVCCAVGARLHSREKSFSGEIVALQTAYLKQRHMKRNTNRFPTDQHGLHRHSKEQSRSGVQSTLYAF